MEIRIPKSDRRKQSVARRSKSPARCAVRNRSAELYSAVSQICNLRSVETDRRARVTERSAECNSAIQQIENLRYGITANTATSP